MNHKLIVNTCFLSLLLFVLQALLFVLLKEVSYKEDYRFKQTRLFSSVILCLTIFVVCILIFGENYIHQNMIYVYFSGIITLLIEIEILIRKKETKNKDLTKIVDFYNDTNLSFVASIFYQKDENEIVVRNMAGNITKSLIIVLGVTNVCFATLLPILIFARVIMVPTFLYFLLMVFTLLYSEIYLFLSQKNLEFIELDEEETLLQTPKEWIKDIEDRYGNRIIGFSNVISPHEKEISTMVSNLEKLSRDVINGKNILLSNASKYEMKAVYYNAINKDFINGKATLIIYEDLPSIVEAREVVDSIITEYNNELILKVISQNSKMIEKTDKEINIYLTTIQDLIEASIDYNKIETVIINNVDKIIERNSNELYVLATTLMNLNQENQYIMTAFSTAALKIAIRNVLLIEEFSEYQINRKTAGQIIGVQVFKRTVNNIKNHESNNNNVNDLVKLAMETSKFNVDSVEILSKKRPLQYDANRFDEIRAERKSTYSNKELTKMTNRIKVNCNNIFKETANKKMFFKNDDEKNLAYNIKSYGELNSGETYLGIVSSNYMLRDFIISEYLSKSGNLSDLDIIVPSIMENDAKILLGSLLMQMLNRPVKEDVIIRRLKEYSGELVLMKDYNKLSIITAINSLLESEFKIKTNITNYLIESVDNFGKKEYMLNSSFKLKLPKDLYDKAKIIKSGYVQDITKFKGYEIYQKYIPGQIHFIENKVYKIDDINNLDISVSNVSVDGLRIYKQDSDVFIENLGEIEKEEIRKYADVTINTKVQKADVKIKPKGYYEFLDYTTLEDGTYVYRKLTENQKEAVNREYYNNRILKISITPETPELKNIIDDKLRDKLSCTFAFLINELFESLLDENAPFVTARAIIKDDDLTKNEEIKLYTPVISSNKKDLSVEICIIEDLKISKGLLSTIENEIPRILMLIKKYLIWYEGLAQDEENYLKHVNINNSLVFNEMNKILPKSL